MLWAQEGKVSHRVGSAGGSSEEQCWWTLEEKVQYGTGQMVVKIGEEQCWWTLEEEA